MLSSIPSYWAGPISTIIVVFGSIALLYPIVWRLTLKQLNAALKAIELAKELPEVASKIEELSEKLKSVQNEFHSLTERLPDFEAWTDKFTSLNRLADDLAKKIDDLGDREAGNAIATTQTKEHYWDDIRSSWVEIKGHVEGIISNISDGRKRRKYAGTTRYSYEHIAQLLYDDNLINKLQRDALTKSDVQFRSLRNKRTPVDAKVKASFDKWKADVIG